MNFSKMLLTSGRFRESVVGGIFPDISKSGGYMKKVLVWIAPLVLAIGGSAMLRADDAPPPMNAEVPKNFQATSDYIWYIAHYSEVAKDPEAMGVAAVGQAHDMLKSQGANAEIDFFMKMIYQTKSHAVERAIRVQLAQIYKDNGRPEKAMEQLQTLMTEAP
jgi:hypothetical protein